MADSRVSEWRVVFDGGRLTLDGGLHWLAQAEAQVDAAARFAWQIRDWRSGPIRHSLETLVRQRLLQIACASGTKMTPRPYGPTRS